jgi:hypothetical protein
MRRKNRTKRQYRKSFTKRRTKRTNRTKRTKRTKKSSKSNNDLKRFKKLQEKLEKLFMNNASKKEIDKTSEQLADLQKKMIKANKGKMKGGSETHVQEYLDPKGHGEYTQGVVEAFKGAGYNQTSWVEELEKMEGEGVLDHFIESVRKKQQRQTDQESIPALYRRMAGEMAD